MYLCVIILLSITLATTRVNADFTHNIPSYKCFGTYTWTRYTSSEPGPSSRFDLSVAASGSSFYVYGGKEGPNWNYVNDLWIFTTSSGWTRATTTGNAPNVSDHSLSVYGGNLFLFGGNVNGVPSNTLYRIFLGNFSIQQVTTINTPPTPRQGHAAVVRGDFLYIYGGSSTSGGDAPLSDFWSLNLKTFVWTKINIVTPPSRLWMSATLVKDQIWVYGGFNGVEGQSDTWSYNFSTNKWTQSTTASPLDPRSGQATFADSRGFYVVGGEHDVQGLILNNNDAWFFDVSKQKWRLLCAIGTTPSSRLGAVGTSFTVGGRPGALIFGGISTDAQFNNVIFSNELWGFTVIDDELC